MTTTKNNKSAFVFLVSFVRFVPERGPSAVAVDTYGS
jgi:hypothetical protein